jgi:hypothetical protein
MKSTINMLVLNNCYITKIKNTEMIMQYVGSSNVFVPQTFRVKRQGIRGPSFVVSAYRFPIVLQASRFWGGLYIIFTCSFSKDLLLF